jgi:hypothetical protein
MFKLWASVKTNGRELRASQSLNVLTSGDPKSFELWPSRRRRHLLLARWRSCGVGASLRDKRGKTEDVEQRFQVDLIAIHHIELFTSRSPMRLQSFEEHHDGIRGNICAMDVKDSEPTAGTQNSDNQRQVLLLFRSQELLLTIHHLYPGVSRMDMAYQVLGQRFVGQTELQKGIATSFHPHHEASIQSTRSTEDETLELTEEIITMMRGRSANFRRRSI